MVKVVKNYVKVNKYTRPGLKLSGVKGIVMHWTATPGASALNERNYFNGTCIADKRYASAHYFVDRKEAQLIIPENEVAYHAHDQSLVYQCDKKKHRTDYSAFVKVFHNVFSSLFLNKINEKRRNSGDHQRTNRCYDSARNAALDPRGIFLNLVELFIDGHNLLIVSVRRPFQSADTLFERFLISFKLSDLLLEDVQFICLLHVP